MGKQCEDLDGVYAHLEKYKSGLINVNGTVYLFNFKINSTDTVSNLFSEPSIVKGRISLGKYGYIINVP